MHCTVTHNIETELSCWVFNVGRELRISYALSGSTAAGTIIDQRDPLPASSASGGTSAAGFKLEEKVSASASDAATVAALDEEESKLEELQAAIEVEFEVLDPEINRIFIKLFC
ncbi:hypothetical protein MANES_12G106911v8 [Manihot esculenta]|uniref:Uncharacterized protein n=1 Tax=Manihot esculenta TaxID=3983 RepID=A0ACB7GQG9_MANES|nr:hypothetical protein MANES_12G106911v8 [Manihot esculenta]